MEPTTIGLIVFVIGWSIREMLSYLKQKALRDDSAQLEALHKSMKVLKDEFTVHDNSHALAYKQISELHTWHNKEDQDGIKVWYFRKSLEEALQESAKALSALAQSTITQTRLLEELTQLQKDVHRETLSTSKVMEALLQSKNINQGKK